jgi:predicted nuclease of predicted toxin-antitoxin system
VRIKLDENVPADFTPLLATQGHGVDTVASEGLQGHDDADVWSAASREGQFLITQDLDFSDIRRFRPGTHPGLLLVRLRTPTRQRLMSRLAEILAAFNLDDWAGCLVVVSDHRVRVRRAPG